ncbi:uracil-DNA glycosylase [Carboxydochorda subterranea]|uniref:Type-4 uracil-DNA glycosylase n=1 Tax=Carboxydichorda subterranea TaxID=3109565 RepID=A0ABZ1C0S1_9FIRM|nr:uracil-DNA glycosylase [Limnochorda sp. L945t]WRP18544.1 uracil-DNA glycosylase [Limnochorda sp. L945t]
MSHRAEQLSLFGGEDAGARGAAPTTGHPEPAPDRPPAASDDWVRRLSGARDLQALEAIVKGCTRCGLRATCTQVVFGEGHPRARLMLVGEGPGQVEDETGRPFVGPAGQLLDRMLAAIGLSRRDVYIANVVKCRPPNNRVPTPDEMAACWPNLRRQIELIHPSIVLCLGATAARQLVEPRGSISSLRGRWYVRDGIRYLVTFHPAALLRDPSKKPMAWQDLQMVQRALAELQAASA